MFNVRSLLRIKFNKFGASVIQVQQQYVGRRYCSKNCRFVKKV